MLELYTGEIAALATALCWAVTALAFESAGRKVGSLAVNLIRLVMAVILLSVYNWITRGLLFPTDATAHNWYWLLLSGFIGFTIGDTFLFQAFVVIGARISMLVMALVPPITAFIGWLLLGEKLTRTDLGGMLLTVVGIVIVVLERNGNKTRKTFRHPVKGILFALVGAIGQSVGLVMSKSGMGQNNAFAATQIRIFAGTIGFFIVITILKGWPGVMNALKNRNAMKKLTVGAVFGPFLGVSLSLLSIQYIATGVASTFMAIVPVLIIPPAVILFKEKLSVIEVLGAFIAVSGIAVLFLK